MGILLALVLAAVFVVLPVMVYNKLVTGKNECTNAFAQIQVQLKRRHDLIPNLVETARAYLQHENQTLEAVIAARNGAEAALQAAQSDNAASISQLAEQESLLGGALQRLNMVVESYPELKANQAVQGLHEELVSTENRIGFARQAYNDAVLVYNNSRQVFPNVLLVDFFGHRKNLAPLHFADAKTLEQPVQVRL